MATLTGELISETYDSLLKVTDNNTITGIKKRITDGFGNDIPLLLSSTDLEIDGTLILSALTDLAPATKFLSLKADNSVGFRTSSELLSDIGGASSASISGTTGRLSKFTSSGTVGNSILDEIGNVIHLTDGTSSYASFGINNPGVDNDAYIGSTINNDFLIKINNVEALRIDTALRLKIANIQNALGDTDKFLVSEDGVVKYRTGSEVLADIGGASAGAYVPYSGATSDVNLGAFNITATSLIKAGGVDTQFLKADGSVDNNNYLTANDLPSTLSLYATNVPADVTDYFKLVTTIDDPDYNTIAVDVPTGEITTTDQLIASLVSPVNLINGNPGVFNVTTTGNITRISGSGEAEFFFRIYKRDSVGVETLVGTSGNTIPVINTGYSEFFATAIWNDGIFDVTDSIVLKYYANRIAGGSNPTYQFQFGGDQPVRTIVPIPTAVIPNIFLEQLADVEDGVEANNDGIFFDSSVSLWKYKSVSEVLGYTPANDARTITINGTTQDLSANRTYSVGTVTSVSALTLGTSGTDLSSTVANSTTTPVITLNVPDASATARGVITTGSQTIGGAKTFSLDTIINGLTIGHGGGNLGSNTVVGFESLFSNTTGHSNTANGLQSLFSNTTGIYNSAFGIYSLVNNTTGGANTAIGNSAINNNTTGELNTALGYLALSANTTGSSNIGIGFDAGSSFGSGGSNQTSSNSVYLGNDTRASASGNTNEIVIGDSARGGGSNSATLGNTSIATTILHGNTSIGYTTNPSLYKLDVNGTGRFAGDVLISKSNTTDTILKVQNGTNFYASVFQLVSNNDGGAAYSSISLATNGGTTHWQIGGGGAAANTLPFYTGGVKRLEIASTGAATFSSSVTTAGLLFNTNDSVFGNQSSITRHSVIGLTLRGATASVFDFAIYSANGTALFTNPTGTNNINFNTGNVGIGVNAPRGQLSITNQVSGGADPISSYAATNGVIGQNFFNGYYAANSDGLGTYPRYLDIVSVGSPDGTNGGSNIRFFTNPIASSSPAVERMRITSGGNVGIGTTTPTNFSGYTTLNIDNTAGSFTEYRQGNTNTFRVGSNESNGGFLFTQGSTPIRFGTIDTERMRITSGGNVLIGTTSDNGAKLQVNGGAYINGVTSNLLSSHGEKFISLGGPGSSFSFDMATQFPNLGIINNVLGVTMSFTIYGTGGSVYAAIATIARNTVGTWSAYSLTAATSTAALLQSITGSGTTITINTISGSYVGVKVTAIVQ